MFAFICGEICGVAPDGGLLILKNNDVGYNIFVSNATLTEYGEIGKRVQLFTYMHIKEDGITLYGFKSESEKGLFIKLISVSGIGPKMAVNILGGFKLSDLLLKIVQGDTAALSAVKGVGKKTAERIVLELKEKIKASEINLSKDESFSDGFLQNGGEAVETLTSLGFTKAIAQRAVDAAMDGGAKTTEEILKIALRNM
jgi:Holliday junction DNA helicase RuvA